MAPPAQTSTPQSSSLVDGKVILPPPPKETEEKVQLKLPILSSSEFSFNGNPLFTKPPEVKIISPEVLAERKDFASFGNDFANKNNFHNLLNALEQQAYKLNNKEIADLFHQMKLTVNVNQVIDENQFRPIQREILYKHGLYIDTPFQYSSLSKRILAVEQVQTYELVSGEKYPVHLLDNSTPSTEYGRFTPLDMAVVDYDSAMKAVGEKVVTAVIANELAHYYLNSRGFIPYSDKFVSLNSLKPENYSEGTPGRLALSLLKSEQSASNLSIHELISDCWSTAESPTFDQNRLLQILLQHESLEKANRELGNPPQKNNYDLSLKIYKKISEDVLKETRNPNIIDESIESLSSYHKRYMELTSQMERNPFEENLEKERNQLDVEYLEFYNKSTEKIKSALGEAGLNAQLKAFAAINEELQNLLFKSSD